MRPPSSPDRIVHHADIISCEGESDRRRVAVGRYEGRVTAHQILGECVPVGRPHAGMTVLPVEVQGPEPDEIEPAFATIRKERPGALLVIAEPTIGAHRRRIAEFAIKNRLRDL